MFFLFFFVFFYQGFVHCLKRQTIKETSVKFKKKTKPWRSCGSGVIVSWTLSRGDFGFFDFPLTFAIIPQTFLNFTHVFSDISACGRFSNRIDSMFKENIRIRASGQSGRPAFKRFHACFAGHIAQDNKTPINSKIIEQFMLWIFLILSMFYALFEKTNH